MEVRVDERAADALEPVHQETAPGKTHDEVGTFRLAQPLQKFQCLGRVDGEIRSHDFRPERHAQHVGELVGPGGGQAVGKEDLHRL